MNPHLHQERMMEQIEEQQLLKLGAGPNIGIIVRYFCKDIQVILMHHVHSNI